MQTQQQKPLKQDYSPKQRLSVGEVVVAVLNLLIGAVGGLSAYSLLYLVGDSPILIFPGSACALGALGAILAGILIFLRQRRLAVYALWLAAVGALGFFGISAWSMLKNALSYLYPLPLLIAALIFAWFAWFLKRLDESG